MKIANVVAAGALAMSMIAGSALADTTKTKVDDSWITTKVKADLAKDSATKANEIHVNTKSGVVVLTGNVASAAEKEKAESDAKAVKGVVNVENQLVVSAAAAE
jgi:hyperosmotically inducible protein